MLRESKNSYLLKPQREFLVVLPTNIGSTPCPGQRRIHTVNPPTFDLFTFSSEKVHVSPLPVRFPGQNTETKNSAYAEYFVSVAPTGIEPVLPH